MRSFVLFLTLLTAGSAATLADQPGRVVLSPLAAPDLAEDATPSDVLRAAQGALATGHSGRAQEALEMAQTRMLDRSVALGETNSPSDNPTVGLISQALAALAAHDRAGCMQLIQTALVSAAAQGL